MTPRRDNNDEGEDEDLRAYEVDGWRVGFEVEMNGVGIAGGPDGDGDSDFTDSDEESADGDEPLEASPYAEYQALPMQVEDPGDETEEDRNEGAGSNTVEPSTSISAFVSPPIRKEFEKLLQESSMSMKKPTDEIIPHQPTNITLDADKIETIRTAMLGFTLPPPPHMANLDDRQLTFSVQKLLHLKICAISSDTCWSLEIDLVVFPSSHCLYQIIHCFEALCACDHFPFL
ncbi:unnamed protein product [Cylicocyclus nassatus]|uniref:Uncharacterized protein n=1 Tax=Cylicocyclus nassatus TaxID=53992 RepID=A0AA36DRQ2_CYLNA|nr:unnamed protein product [Cylicocyclus nassatus]